MISTYKITVESLGKITQLLDSQKIFGALMYQLSEATGKDEVGQFISEIKAGERLFMVSNLMPKGYLPVPNLNLAEAGMNKDDYKKLKPRKYISVDQINKSIKLTSPYIKIVESQDAKYRISNELFQIPGLKNDLFSIPTIQVREVRDENDHGQVVSYFNFYIAFKSREKVEEKLIEHLKMLKKENPVFLFGQKASHGYNTYRMTKVKCISDELAWNETDSYLNLGMLLPKIDGNLDFSQSKLKLFTSERRPYQMGIGQGTFEQDNNFISFVEAGSMIKLKTDTEWLNETHGKLNCIGKSVKSPYDEKRIVFGQSFLYPLKEEPKL